MEENKSRLSGVAVVIACGVIVVWVGMLIATATQVDAQEVHWSRMLALLGSLEAVAFAAAGALFGTTIQRQRVDDARKQAVAAESKTTEALKESAKNARDAANGKALATAIRVRWGGSASAGGAERVSALHADSGLPQDLAALASELFPD